MARVTPEEYAADWGQGMKQAGNRIRRGIEKVTEAPGAKAARAAERMLQNLITSIQDGTWAAQVGKVTLEEWKDSALNKGLQRIAAGVDQAQPKQAEMARRLLAAVDASVAEANQTPRGDLEANIQRMVAFSRGMAKRKLRRPGS